MDPIHRIGWREAEIPRIGRLPRTPRVRPDARRRDQGSDPGAAWDGDPEERQGQEGILTSAPDDGRPHIDLSA